ncbi:MAG: cupin domain-containing protein [Bryobacteraceae bacterium]
MHKLTPLFLLTTALCAQSVRVIPFSESKPFTMGDVTSRRIVHPDLGAKQTTLNYSVSRPGAEFAQHTHDASSDTILVLQGEVNLRQGSGLHLFKAGEAAYIPGGEVHGTVTAGTGEAIMISFQNPPDFKLYSGARDSKKAGGAAPQGSITPGAVKYVRFDDKNGSFTSPAIGAKQGVGAHRRLSASDSFKTKVAAGAEQVLFVWKGGIAVNDGKTTHKAGEKDTVFIQGPAEITVSGAAPDSRVIQIQAPPSTN